MDIGKSDDHPAAAPPLAAAAGVPAGALLARARAAAGLRRRQAGGRPDRLALGLVLALFGSGLAAGVAADRLLLGHGHDHGGRHGWHGPPSPEEMTRRLRRELKLSEQQAGAVAEIQRQDWRQASVLFGRIEPELRALRQGSDARVRELLDPQQRQRFAELVARAERQRAEAHRQLTPENAGPGAPPPPR